MPRSRAGKTPRLVYFENEVDAWLKQDAEAADRTITAQLNRHLRACMAAEQKQQPQRKAC